MRRDWEADYVEYVAARAAAHRRTAYLLCGDWHHAEDLTQQALTKLYRVWRRLDRTGSVDGYVRRMLLRAYLDERRRPWRREHPVRAVPDGAVAVDPVEDRLALLAALAALPPNQRAVVVLRYWEDLSIADTAEVLQIRAGTVKSAGSRGLAALRAALNESATSV